MEGGQRSFYKYIFEFILKTNGHTSSLACRSAELFMLGGVTSYDENNTS